MVSLPRGSLIAWLILIGLALLISRADAVEQPQWIVELRDSAGNLREVTSEERSSILSVQLSVRQDGPLSCWRISVDNHSDEWGIWAVHFPIIKGLATEDDSYYAWPNGTGVLVREPLKHLPMWGVYPARSPSMQFSVLGRAEGALYLGVHDPQARLKEIRLEEDGAGAAQYRVTHFPDDMGAPGRNFRLPFDIVIGQIDGDWIDACKIYRDWVIEQEWCPAPLAERDDVPQWFLDIAIWFHANGPQTAAETQPLLDYVEFLDAPVAIHWYNWHQYDFDYRYPEYLPAKPGALEWARKLRAAGIRMIPYINGRIWDVNTPSFVEENAADHTSLNPFLLGDEPRLSYSTRIGDGQPNAEHWGQTDFAVMCPGTEFWQDKIADICKRIVQDLEVDGVYLDQTGCTTPVLCFNTAHGHPAGGSHWTAGNQELTRKSREQMQAVNPEAILATEGNAESYEATDALLAIYDTPFGLNLVPMFHYVYSGRKVTFGRMARGDGPGFSQQSAQCFIWGSQMGWEALWDNPMVAPGTPYGNYVKELARVFTEEAKRFTRYGEMLRPAQVVGDIPEETGNWGPGPLLVTLPVILHSRWLAPDGTEAIVMTNWSNTSQTINFALYGVFNLPPRSAQVIEL